MAGDGRACTLALASGCLCPICSGHHTVLLPAMLSLVWAMSLVLARVSSDRDILADSLVLCMDALKRVLCKTALMGPLATRMSCCCRTPDRWHRWSYDDGQGGLGIVCDCIPLLTLCPAPSAPSRALQFDPELFLQLSPLHSLCCCCPGQLMPPALVRASTFSQVLRPGLLLSGYEVVVSAPWPEMLIWPWSVSLPGLETIP